MNEIEFAISQAVEGFTVHHDSDVDEDDLLDPVVEEYSNYESFSDLAEAAGLDEDYAGVSIEDFDAFVRREVIHPQVSGLHSLLTLAMNHYQED